LDYLTVKSVSARGGTLLVDFECKGRIEKFLTANHFFAQYNVSLYGVPEQLLIIPFLSMVCPIVWANQGILHVKTIDASYLDSLGQVQSVLGELFPEIGFGGKICAQKVVESREKARSKSMMLFSGGVDSLATYIRHKEERPLLVTVRGAEVRLQDLRRWEAIIREIKHFASGNGLEFRTVCSNFYDLFDHLMGTTFHRELFEGTWWVAVMHSLSLVGLCAPLTYVDDVGKIYIASSLTEEFKRPRGCVPQVDKKVYWSGTSCLHDGYELSRQQKINLIAEFARNEKTSFPLRVCGKRNLKLKLTQSGNCSNSKCEKCSRTIIGLELAGLDPNNFGFEATPDFFLEIRSSVENHVWKFGCGEKFLWNDILQHAKSRNHLPHPGAEQFMSWMLKTDIETITSISIENLMRKIVLYISPIFKYLPNWLWKIVRAFYSHLIH
jgi:hypothetical protein